MLQAYILPSLEVARIREAGGPLADLPLDTIRDRGEVAVVEVDGRIVAYWVVCYALHADPLWIDPAFRTHPGVSRGLLTITQGILASSGEPVSFAIIGEADMLQHGINPARLGFVKVPGELYYLVVPQEPQ